MAKLKVVKTVVILTSAVFLSLCPKCLAQNAAAQSCDSSTVDDLDPGMAKRAKAFLAKLKAAVGSDDKEQIAGMVAYPLRVFEGDSKRAIHSPREFTADYNHLLAPSVKRAVLAQSPDCLFANYQGVMIDNGVIWFREPRNSTFKIITINLGKAANK
jgi:hypothetical protein